MTAPTFPYGNITLDEVKAGRPGKQELFEKMRTNPERLYEILLGAGVSPDDAAVAVGHRHLGKAVDGTATISSQPQANLILGSDNPSGFTKGATADAGDIGFADGAFGDIYEIKRANGNVGAFRVSIHEGVVSADIIKKIKSAGGKGCFTCSVHMKRVAAAAGVVGGTLRFGVWDGAAFVAGGFVDIDFDDVTTEYKRFYFTSDQLTRPAAINLRAEWTASPTDWDTIAEEDDVGYIGGFMITNGGALAKWDIAYYPGGLDDYDADANNLFYWWDENITEVEQTV